MRLEPLRPEHALLLACTRLRTAEAPPGHFDALLAERIGWAVVLAEASEHGVAPLLHRHLATAEGVPTDVRATLKADAQRIAAGNLLLAHVLLGVMRAFEDAGVQALAYKGPVQGVLAYGALDVRPFADLDVLVPWPQLERALDVLAAMGYEMEERPPPDVLHTHYYHVSTYHPGNDVLVEVHWKPVSVRGWLDLGEALWERPCSVSLAGGSVPTLSLEAALLVICTHAAKHHWERLEWAASMAGIVERSPTLDWDRLRRLSERAGTQRALALGLRLARDLASARLPPEAEALREVPGIDSLARQATRLVLSAHRVRGASPKWIARAVRFQAGLRGSWREGAAYFLNPTELEWEASASGSVSPVLARLLRPLLLLKRYLLKGLFRG